MFTLIFLAVDVDEHSEGMATASRYGEHDNEHSGSKNSPGSYN
jgi:hypothetical protein